MDISQIRQALLRYASENSQMSAQANQQATIFFKFQREFASNLTPKVKQDVIDVWQELFRSGYLVWGFDFDEPSPPYYHISAKGLQALEQLERDPANPDGYMAYIKSIAAIDPISESYVAEALETYNNNCYKATLVLIGIATEGIVLNLRDALVSRIQALGRAPSSDLQSWQIKRVLSAMKNAIDPQARSMTDDLHDNYDANWPSLTGHIRALRNDVGHPNKISIANANEAHVVLLLFPNLVKLAEDLKKWIVTSFN